MTFPHKMLLTIFLTIFLFIVQTTGYNILGIFPHTGKSHFTVFNPLMHELARRGHNVTVVSHFPESNPPKGYNPISLYGTGEILMNNIDTNLFKKSYLKPIVETLMLSEWGNDNCKNILNISQIRDRLSESYDLVIAEQFNTDCFLVIPYLLKVPHIAMSSCTIMPYHNDRYGLPSNPSYIPQSLTFFSDRMDFFQRVFNSISTVVVNYIVAPLTMTTVSTKIARNIYGNEVPYLEELGKSTSLVLVNTYSTLNRPRPLPPNVIEVGGIHLSPVKPLPKDIETYLNESTHGVIYFSFGSMLLASSFTPERLNLFLEVFAELPQRILWKYEEDNLPVKLGNVMTRKWLPQNDILSHPKVITFISHCGLGGTIEGVTHGVPMICMPFYGDQYINSAAATEGGGAVQLSFHDFTKDELRKALNLTLNPVFRAQAKRLSNYYNDRPMKPMDTAVYWVEYVARHKGAEHLKPHSIKLNFFQHILLDVICFVVASILLAVYVLVKLLKFLVSLCRCTTKLKQS